MRRLTGARGLVLWCMMLLCCVMMAGTARGDMEMTITGEEDWTWEAGSVCEFQGSILPDQNVSDAEISMAVQTRLEDSGEILFTVVDEERLKIRKRSDTITTDLTEGTEFTFEGEWTIPDEVGSGIGSSTISLRVKDSSGNEVTVGTFQMGNQEVENALANQSPVRRANRLILILSIASVVVWLAAIGRHLMLNRRVSNQ